MEISTNPAERLGRPQAHFINGKRIASGGLRDVLDPATGKPISQLHMGGPSEVDAAVAAARAALPAWSAVAPDERAKLLLRFAELMEANAQGHLRVVDPGRRTAAHDRRGLGAVRVPVPALLRGLDEQDHRQDHAVVGHGQVPDRPARLYPAGTDRRGGRDHALELSVRHGNAQDRAGAGGGLHAGSETRGRRSHRGSC